MVPGGVGGTNCAAGNPFLQNSALRLEQSAANYYMNALLFAKTFDRRQVTEVKHEMDEGAI